MAVSTIHNHDIMGLVRRINRFIIEIAQSQSAGGSLIREADLTRLKLFQVALKFYKTWVVSQPELDLPETHPEEMAVPDPPDVMPSENESLKDVVIMYTKMRDELLNSQSGQVSTGLSEADARRFDDIIAKLDNFITDYIEETNPMDLPESTPTG